MTRSVVSASSGLRRVEWVCRQCQQHGKTNRQARFSTYLPSRAQEQIRAASEIDFGKFGPATPARVVPASPSYFSAFPNYNDDLLMLRSLVAKYEGLLRVASSQAPRTTWRRLTEYRNTSSEQISEYKYAGLLKMLATLNRIPVRLQSDEVKAALSKFRRPGAAALERPKPGQLDQLGRSVGIGRRKAASAKIFLVEGTGEVLINGQNLVTKFPRIHDRESALWPLKISSRLSKYNVFALVTGGGLTGQAEAMTLGLARALLVHEPALKPILRQAGCVTRDRRRVERKKPGHVKARKMPTWVKR